MLTLSNSDFLNVPFARGNSGVCMGGTRILTVSLPGPSLVFMRLGSPTGLVFSYFVVSQDGGRRFPVMNMA